MSKDASASHSAEKEQNEPVGAETQASAGDFTTRAEKSAQNVANLMLLGAIKVNDTGMFERALRQKADVNFSNGMPLQLATETGNSLFLRRLVTAGADIPYALAALEKEQAAIPRTSKRTYDRYNYRDRITYKYENKEDEKRWKEITDLVKRLKTYGKIYMSEVAPLETLRLQHNTLTELQELKDEILTAIHGKPLTKQKLPPPAPPRKKAG